MKPLILVSNDDGYQAPGFRHLVEIATQFGDVVGVAPLRQQSGQSSAITVTSPLRIHQCPDYGPAKIYSVNGTPTDCVKIAMHTICRERRPDFMLSGINHGSNAGCNALYSGTMGAALEACLYGIPAVAFSVVSHDHATDLTPLTPYITEITRRAITAGLPKEVCLNVNMPAGCTPLGARVCRAAKGYWTDEYQDYTDPAGRPFYMLSGRFHNLEPDAADTDEYLLAHGVISIVPTRPDPTALDAIASLTGRFDMGE